MATTVPAGDAAAGQPRFTKAEQRLWEALRDRPGSTAAALSAATGIGKSTAAKILARWDHDSLATRTTPREPDGSLRPADRWTATPAPVDIDQAGTDAGGTVGDTQPAGANCGATSATVAGHADSVSAESATRLEKAGRLRPGDLRGLVEDYLRDHSGEFTPGMIAKALTRSAGAVHNALEKLVQSGYATRTCDKPKQFTLATRPESPAADREADGTSTSE